MSILFFISILLIVIGSFAIVLGIQNKNRFWHFTCGALVFFGAILGVAAIIGLAASRL